MRISRPAQDVQRPVLFAVTLRWACGALCFASLTGALHAQVTERVSLGANGAQTLSPSDLPFPPGSIVSSDGRFVAFYSPASDLVPGDTNVAWDVFVRDRRLGITERVSIASNGAEGNAIAGLYGVSISADGRYVAFESLSNNLVLPDTNGREVFLRDRQSGTTERIALDPSGNQANGPTHYPSLSADGRFVSFTSLASNLVSGDANGAWDVFVRDMQTGTIERVSVSSGGTEGNGDCYKVTISADGRHVAFMSLASNLVTGDTNVCADVFVRDRLSGTTERVSLAVGGLQGNGNSFWPCISADGRYVGFTSEANNFASGDTNSARDVFVHDRTTGTTTLVSVSLGGSPGNHLSQDIWLSGDGGLAVFKSAATDLIPNSPTNPIGTWIFLRDMQMGTTALVSRSTDGSIPSSGGCQSPCLTPDGRFVVFEGNMPTLVPGDTNGVFDVFMHDRFAAGFTSVCDPGTNNVIACPCGNSPSGTGRGCDNSSLTGGAVLSASGIAYLSLDSLAFTTESEKPSATSVLLQGDGLVPTGAIFGQGVRCVGGSMKRLYVKIAAGGSITAPDLAGGDPTVSSRSALLGAPIQPGQPYFYMVYYRDPVVSGGCSAASTFNCTQAGSISWWP